MVHKSRLSNGVTIVTERLPLFRMVHVQLRITAGSGTERREEWGAAHFLEHLTFADQGDGYVFSCKMADYGANFQAKTALDHTTFYIDVPTANLFPVLQLFMKLITNQTIEAERFEAERSVVLSELEMVDDDIFESSLGKFYENMVGEYGHPVIGTEESIRGLSPAMLQAFRDRYYTPDNLLIGIAGDVQHDQVVEKIDLLCAGWKGTSGAKLHPEVRTTFTSVHVPSSSDVVHLLWGFHAPDRQDEDRFPYAVMMKGLTGDGTDMWSHLFYLIRTQRGLAYAVGGEYIFLHQAGLYFFTVITQPENAERVIKMVESEIGRFLKGEVSLEIPRAIATLTSQIYSMEDQLASRVTRMLEQENDTMPFLTAEEEIVRLAKVTKEDVLRTAKKYLRPQLLMTLGAKF